MSITRLTPTEQQQHVGDYYSAAWTADSSSANKAVLSDTITLPAGTYVVSILLPYISTSVFYCSLFNASTNDIVNGKWFHGGGSSSSKTSILKLTAQTSVRICASQSATCTFSYKERGGLVAVRLA